MPKHYHDRGDAENGFDELKNNGAGANLIALLYHGWNLYLRFYDE